MCAKKHNQIGCGQDWPFLPFPTSALPLETPSEESGKECKLIETSRLLIHRGHDVKQAAQESTEQHPQGAAMASSSWWWWPQSTNLGIRSFWVSLIPHLGTVHPRKEGSVHFSDLQISHLSITKAAVEKTKWEMDLQVSVKHPEGWLSSPALLSPSLEKLWPKHELCPKLN